LLCYACTTGVEQPRRQPASQCTFNAILLPHSLLLNWGYILCCFFVVTALLLLLLHLMCSLFRVRLLSWQAL
jgi:hypothetical protein